MEALLGGFTALLEGLLRLIAAPSLLVIVGLLWRIASRVGQVEQWMKTTDKEVSSQGSLLQQLTSSVAEMLGWQKGHNENPPQVGKRGPRGFKGK